MKILVTGADGYIGCLLGPYLMDRGHEVIGVDSGYYREGTLYNSGSGRSPELLTKDIRDLTVEDLSGFNAVAHLAELSNDPLGQLNPTITYEINHLGSVELAKRCIEAGVSRFVYTSSCSVYGIGNDDYKTEESGPNPQTAYAECKVYVERDVSALASDDFSPTFLRNATAYGSSPRQRFDVVLNNLAGFAWTIKEIRMTSDGTPWRPLVHILDICQAVACSIEAPRDIVHKEVFNVGRTDHNYRVREIAEIVAGAFPDCDLSIGDSAGDNRSYRVSFDKIAHKLPGFEIQWDAKAGAQQFRKLFERIQMSSGTVEFRAFTRLKQHEDLIRTSHLDDHCFWT